MEDLSLHILDIVENSIRAKAKNITIEIEENEEKDLLKIIISDDGKGMNEKEIEKALDPFYTTKKGQRFGMGIALLAQAAKEAGGNLSMVSKEGKGTTLRANFKYSHIDRKPLGDLPKTLLSLFTTNDDTDFTFRHKKGDGVFTLDTKEIEKKISNDVLHLNEKIKYLRNKMNEFYSVSS